MSIDRRGALFGFLGPTLVLHANVYIIRKNITSFCYRARFDHTGQSASIDAITASIFFARALSASETQFLSNISTRLSNEAVALATSARMISTSLERLAASV
jgi:hypothetical protein